MHSRIGFRFVLRLDGDGGSASSVVGAGVRQAPPPGDGVQGPARANRPGEAAAALRGDSSSGGRVEDSGAGEPGHGVHDPGVGGGRVGRVGSGSVPGRQRLGDFQRVLLVLDLRAGRCGSGGSGHGQGRRLVGFERWLARQVAF